MDWNWFFGALAQSTAAIVGLAGAFVFTRIVNNESEFKRKTDRLARLLEDAKDLASKADLVDFRGYNSHRRYNCLSLIEEQVKGLGADEEPHSPEEYLLILEFSEYDDVEDLLTHIEEKVEEYQEEAERQAASSASGVGGLNLGSILSDPVVDSQTTIFHAQRREQRERRIGEYRTDVENHAQRVKRFVREAKRNPEHSPAVRKIIGVLVALFLVGVIYPLGNLPFPRGGELVISIGAVVGSIFSFQGLLLVLLSLLFLAVAKVLWSINEGLKHDPDQLAQLAEYEDPANYCEWFVQRAKYREWMAERQEMKQSLLGD